MSVGSVGWLEIHTGNAKAVAEFYELVVGVSSVGEKVGSSTDYNIFPVNAEDPCLGVIESTKLGKGKAVWVPYLIVDSIDDAIARAELAGAKVVIQPSEIAGYGCYCVIEDPFGATTALLEPES